MLLAAILAATALHGGSPPPLPDTAGSASSEGPSVALTVTAPPSCPDAATVRGHLQRLASPRDAPPESADLFVDAVLDESETGFTAIVTLTDAERTRTRTLAAQDCEQLGRAVAVVVAVALDPLTTAARVLPPEDTPADEPAPSDEPAADTPPPAEPRHPLIAPMTPEAEPNDPAVDPVSDDASTTARREPIRHGPADAGPRGEGPFIEAGARLGLGVGGLVLPRAGVGFAAAPFVGVRRFHARLAVQYWAPRDTSLEDLSQAGASFQLVSVGVRGCPILATGRWRFPLCAGFDAGAMIGSGRGDALASRARATAPWTAIVLQPGVELAVTARFGLWGAFEGVFSLNRPRYHLDGGGPLHRAGVFGPRGFVGIVVHRYREPPS